MKTNMIDIPIAQRNQSISTFFSRDIVSRSSCMKGREKGKSSSDEYEIEWKRGNFHFVICSFFASILLCLFNFHRLIFKLDMVDTHSSHTFFSLHAVRLGMRKGYLSDIRLSSIERWRTDWSLCVWCAEWSLRTSILIFYMSGDVTFWQFHHGLQHGLWHVGF